MIEFHQKCKTFISQSNQFTRGGWKNQYIPFYTIKAQNFVKKNYSLLSTIIAIKMKYKGIYLKFTVFFKRKHIINSICI